MSKDALATVEPTVRSPSEGVKSFVGVLISPAIEQDLRFPRRLGLVAIFDGNEHEIRSSAHPNATETNFKTADEIQAFHEHSAAVELAIAISIFEDQDAVLPLPFWSADGIGVGFGDPEAPAIINCKSDWLFYVRFTSEQGGLKAGRNSHFFGGVFGRKAGEFDRVHRHLVLSYVRRIQFVREGWALGIEAEVIEVNVAPAATFLIDEANEDFFAFDGMEIGDDRAKVFAVVTGGFEDDFLIVGADRFDAGFGRRAASHQKSGERLSNLEGFRSECALRAVAEDFVAADPIIPLMLATHVGTASRYCIAFDRLLIESSTRSGPVLETAGFKVEVERTAGFVGGEKAVGWGGQERGNKNA